MLEENLAYVRLTQFGESSDEELEALLTTLTAQNPAGLILDLRRNPGGSLETAVNVADQFLPEGVILYERFGNGRQTDFDSSDRGLADDIPLVLLIDEGSASASEVLAGAIQDRERGILIGQTTFGKGTVQSWQELRNGGGLRLTTARWLTPDDNWVHETGLTPDYFIPLVEGEEDTQLEAAVDFLLGEEVISIPPESG
jgi:carboxyl-terminal processing protease